MDRLDRRAMTYLMGRGLTREQAEDVLAKLGVAIDRRVADECSPAHDADPPRGVYQLDTGRLVQAIGLRLAAIGIRAPEGFSTPE